MATKKTTKPKQKPAEEVITTYKGFDSNFQCRGFQYEIGGEYTHKGAVKACKSGFHACEHPLNVFDYYPPARSIFAVVEQSGELSRESGDTKVASRNIKIKAEIGIAGLVKAAIEYVTASCGPVDPDSPASATGDRGPASATGDRGAASATGDQGAASATGHRGAASATGYRGAASATGDRGAASATGHRGAASATGYQGAASATGPQGAASATGYQGAASATGPQGAASATGHRGAASATGDQGAASATGDQGAASVTGDQGAASATGPQGAASATGYQGAASVTGDQGAASATGLHSVATAAGIGCKAKGADGCALFLVYRDEDAEDNDYGRILHAKAVIVGRDGIQPDTWYRLNEDGEIEIAD